MHPLSTHACLANVSSLKITTTPVLKMNIFFSTDLASISDETDIKNSKVGLRCKINKAFMDFFCIMDDFLKFHVVRLNIWKLLKYGKK